MSKCNENICDLCGKHIISDRYVIDGNEYTTIKLKIKKWWSSWYEGGWTKETIHICPICQSEIKEFFLRGEQNDR